MGRPSRPPLTLGAQASRSQSQICDSSRNVLASPGSLDRLTNAPSPTVPRYLENISASKCPPRCGEAQKCEGEGQFGLGQWKHHRPDDEQWRALSHKSSSRPTSKTIAAIEESLEQLHLSESGYREHGRRKAGDCSGSGNTERRSSTKAGRQSPKASNGNGRRSYADVARHLNSSRVKYGQLLWSTKVSSFLACFCCKMKAMDSCSSSPRIHSQLCQCVQDERTCRRGSAERHVVSGNTQTDVDYISLQQYNELNGTAYERARNTLRARRLRGRTREEFLWREGFVFLYPDFEEVKGLLDPYGYDITALDTRIVRVVETVRRRWQQQRTSLSRLQAAGHGVTYSDAAVQLTTHGEPPLSTQISGTLYSGASGTYNYQEQPPVSGSQSRSYANTALLSSRDFEPALLRPRPATPNQAHPFEQYHGTLYQGHFALQENGLGYQDAQDEMQTRRSDQSQNSQHVHLPPGDVHGRLTQSVLPRSLEGPAPYQRPPSSYISPYGEVRRQVPLSGPFNPTMQQHHESFSGPWTQLRIHERRQHDEVIQTTEVRTPSSALYSTPGLTHELSSARTNRSSLLRPPTPGGPASPSPQTGPPREVHSSVVRDLEIPLEYIDPRILIKSYRLDDFDYDARS